MSWLWSKTVTYFFSRYLSASQRICKKSIKIHPSFKGNLDINAADEMHVSTNSFTPVVAGDDPEGEGDNQTKIDAEKLGSGS